MPRCCCFIAEGHGAAAIPQILWHLYLISPEHCRAAESRISAGVQSSQSEGQGKRVWYRGGRWGDRVPLCPSAALWIVEAFQMQLKGPPGVKRLFVIITDSSHRLKACRAPTTYKLLDFTLKSIPFPDYFLSHETHNNCRPARADSWADTHVCPCSVLSQQCLHVHLSLFMPFLLFVFFNNITRLQKMFTTNPAKSTTEPTGLLGVLHQPFSVQLLVSCSPQEETRGRGKKRKWEEEEKDMREINKWRLRWGGQLPALINSLFASQIMIFPARLD